MVYQHIHPPLTAVEKTLVDTFCILRPCQALRALRNQSDLDQGENREAFYAACRTICTRVHFCPLEGGYRYIDAAKPDRPCRLDPADTFAPSPRISPPSTMMSQRLIGGCLQGQTDEVRSGSGAVVPIALPSSAVGRKADMSR